MRRTLSAIVLSLVCAATDFDDGWQCGWDQGWKQVKGDHSFAPFDPFAPFPPIGHDDYRSGYNLGFLAGIAKASQD